MPWDFLGQKWSWFQVGPVELLGANGVPEQDGEGAPFEGKK